MGANPYAAGALVAIALGSAIYQGVSASDAADKADKQREEDKAAQEKQIEDAKKEAQAQKDEMATEEAANVAAQDALKNRDSQRARQKTLAVGARGRSDTILTSPLGVQQYEPSATKTLLGS